MTAQTAPVASEGRFTKPTDECPAPERWHSTDPDSTEVEVTELVGSFVRALQPDYVVETGTAFGQTTQVIAEALGRNGHGQIDSLEIDTLRAQQARERLAGFVNVRVVQASSTTDEFTPVQPIDFLWLDSGVNMRHLEMRRFRGWCHHRTVVGFHDTGPQHVVRLHVQSLVKGHVITEPLWLPTPRGVAFARVNPC